jgi:hypothetical protein
MLDEVMIILFNKYLLNIDYETYPVPGTRGWQMAMIMARPLHSWNLCSMGQRLTVKYRK